MPTPPRFTTTTKRPSNAILSIHKVSQRRAIAVGATREQLEELLLRHDPKARLTIKPLNDEDLASVAPRSWRTLTGSVLGKPDVEKARSIGSFQIDSDGVGDLIDSIAELAKHLRRTDTMAVFIDWER
jgi:hypothetical protein